MTMIFLRPFQEATGSPPLPVGALYGALSAFLGELPPSRPVPRAPGGGGGQGRSGGRAENLTVTSLEPCTSPELPQELWGAGRKLMGEGRYPKVSI